MGKKNKKEDIEVLEEYDIIDTPSKKEENKEKISNKIYIGYSSRLGISCILLIILSIISISTLYHSFKVGDLVNVRYKEKSSSKYKIFKNEEEELQKESEIYEEEEIDHVIVDIDYLFEMDKETSLDFTKEVVGKLLILDKNNPEKVYYEDTYKLSKVKKDTIVNQKEYRTSEEVQIDYKDYNNIASKFVTSYGVETESYLEVTLNIKYKESKNNTYKLSGESNPSIKIPLASESVKISENNINTEKRVNKKPDVSLEKPYLFGMGILTTIGSIFALSYMITLIYSTIETKDIYDRTVQKILKKYGNSIKTVDKTPRKKGKKIVRVNSFEELWNIKKRVKGYILYNVITEHTKCEFYINEFDKIYIVTIKKVDLEKKINK